MPSFVALVRLLVQLCPQTWRRRLAYCSAFAVNIHTGTVLPSWRYLRCYPGPLRWARQDFMDCHTVLSYWGLTGMSLACLVNGVLVEFLKVIVGRYVSIPSLTHTHTLLSVMPRGFTSPKHPPLITHLFPNRPRPDFFFRCFPDGQASSNLWCTGDPQTVDEGRKSFPSGHTACEDGIHLHLCVWPSLSYTGFFCCFGYLSLYLCGKLQCFQQGGRGKSWRLCVVAVPLLAATTVGASRIHDNMHHWEDVVAGGVIGMLPHTHMPCTRIPAHTLCLLLPWSCLVRSHCCYSLLPSVLPQSIK